ncbi:MAG: lipoate--protein ligase family protein [Armatimonadetes bacterium]|nr:lipoate--protein ligase family protein [Armatimonadota bacterium]
MSDAHIWRLVWSGFAPADVNMAVDEMLFEQVAEGDAPPTLRIYGWEPPGVSIGFAQDLEQGVDLEAVQRRGYGLVRRPTGGRAIIHRDEVTYSVCIRVGHLACGDSVVASYREISRGIEAGLALLGVGAGIPDGRRDSPRKPADLPSICFASSLGGDMEVAGRKIVGSAQMRRSGAILQHGAIPITLDPAEHLEILGKHPRDAGNANGLSHHATTVAEVLGRSVCFDELGRAVVSGFAEAFGVLIAEQPLTDSEQARTAELVESKYGTERWTRTRGRR